MISVDLLVGSPSDVESRPLEVKRIFSCSHGEIARVG